MSRCLTPDELRDFLIGQLPPGAESQAAAHFDQCERCQNAAQQNVDWGPVETYQSAIQDSEDTCPAKLPSSSALSDLYKLARPAAEAHKELQAVVDIPERIGDYHVLRLLAQGSTSHVYLAVPGNADAKPPDPDTLVAVKVLAPECVSRPQHRRRFERERNTLAELPAHPNVVRVLDSCLTDDTRYLVMEYAGGSSLYQLLAAQPLISIEQACRLTIQAATGLQHIHDHGLTHRDITPSNLILDSNGTLRIVDFGIVHQAEIDSLESRLTDANTLIGTIDFMAPEQATDVRNVGARADIYSLGCTLAWMLTGRLVFECQKLPETLAAHSSQPPPSLRNRRAEIPARLDALFQRMVAKKPDERPESAQDVIAELEGCLATLCEAGNRSDSRTATVSADACDAAAPPSANDSGPRRSRWLFAAGVLLAIALTVISVLLTR